MKRPMGVVLSMSPERVYREFTRVDWSKFGFVHVPTYFMHLRRRFGVDVLSLPWSEDVPFVVTEGRTVTGKRIKCVVYKMEHLNDDTFADMCRAVGQKPAKLLRVNDAEQKVYSELYAEVKAIAAPDILASERAWYERVYRGAPYAPKVMRKRGVGRARVRHA